MKNLEIERRWLLCKLPTGLEPDETIHIKQWYREDDGGIVRYRQSISSKSSIAKFEKIIKTPIAPGVSEEENHFIQGNKFGSEIGPSTRYVSKIRRIYHFGGLKFEVDDFRDMKLIICEVEFPNVEALNKPIEFHPGLHNLIIKEITGEREFSNFNLAKFYKE